MICESAESAPTDRPAGQPADGNDSLKPNMCAVVTVPTKTKLKARFRGGQLGDVQSIRNP